MSSKNKKNKNKNKSKKNKKQDPKTKRKHQIKEVASYVIIILIGILMASHLNVVVSGSMEPAFYRGDIVAIENVHTFYGTQEFDPENDVHVGDVVVYDAAWYDDPVIHRVIEIDTINGSKYYMIKGDNNQNPDPYYVEPSRIKAKVITVGGNLLVIPKLGYITLTFRGL